MHLNGFASKERTWGSLEVKDIYNILLSYTFPIHRKRKHGLFTGRNVIYNNNNNNNNRRQYTSP